MTLREVGRKVQTALALPAPKPEPMPAPLIAGKRTMCDSVVMGVRRALSQSITRKQAVTETIAYKQAGNSDVRNGMISAARELANGIELNVAARNVGLYCLSKPFEF